MLKLSGTRACRLHCSCALALGYARRPLLLAMCRHRLTALLTAGPSLRDGVAMTNNRLRRLAVIRSVIIARSPPIIEMFADLKRAKASGVTSREQTFPLE